MEATASAGHGKSSGDPVATLQEGKHGAKTNGPLALYVSPDSVDQLLVTLCEVAAKWILFAGQLGVPNARINIINRDIPTSGNHSIECLRATLVFWTAKCVEPTYDKLVDALKSPVINEEVLAVSVQEVAENLEGQNVPDSAVFKESMSTNEVCVWLSDKGMEKEDCEKFKDNSISGKVFTMMRPEHVSKLSLSLGAQIILEDILTGVRGQQMSPASKHPGGSRVQRSHDTDPIWDEKPTFGNLQLLKWIDKNGEKREVRILKEAAPFWKHIGGHLELSPAELDIIRKNNVEDQVGCLRDVFTKWLTNGSRLSNAHLYPVNWQGLRQMLVDSQLEDTIAKHIPLALLARDSSVRRTLAGSSV